MISTFKTKSTYEVFWLSSNLRFIKKVLIQKQQSFRKLRISSVKYEKRKVLKFKDQNSHWDYFIRSTLRTLIVIKKQTVFY